MRIVTYYCDRCKTQIEKSEASRFLLRLSHDDEFEFEANDFEFDVCPKCRAELKESIPDMFAATFEEKDLRGAQNIEQELPETEQDEPETEQKQPEPRKHSGGRIPKETIREAMRLYHCEGETIKQIQFDLGVGGAIEKHIDKYTQLIKDARKGGASIEQISEQYGFSPETVTAALL